MIAVNIINTTNITAYLPNDETGLIKGSRNSLLIFFVVGNMLLRFISFVLISVILFMIYFKYFFTFIIYNE